MEYRILEKILKDSFSSDKYFIETLPRNDFNIKFKIILAINKASELELANIKKELSKVCKFSISDNVFDENVRYINVFYFYDYKTILKRRCK